MEKESETVFSLDYIKNVLAIYYRQGYDECFRLRAEATAALHDDDTEAFKAITRRADKKSDFTAGIKAAALWLGVSDDEFMAAVNTDRAPVK